MNFVTIIASDITLARIRTISMIFTSGEEFFIVSARLRPDVSEVAAKLRLITIKASV